MKIYITRHGVTEMNTQKKVNGQLDESLSQEGIEQAQAATLLLPKSIRHMYSSSLQRAAQTAEIFKTVLKLPVSLENSLSEIHMGTLAGKSWDEMENGAELKKKHRSVQFDYRPYGGESLEQVKKRLINFLKMIRGRYKDFEVLVITHSGIIRILQLLDSGEVFDETHKHVSLFTIDVDKILKNA